MKKIYRILTVLAVVVVASACSVTGYNGLTDNAIGNKIGKSSYNVWLGVFITNGGDASIKSAAENGDITKVATVDQTIRMGLFKSTFTTRVTGE